ncbi:hypothetical protein [Sphingomonas sp.]|jgi:hypothetical protein|nr:hypothetical protein [Sphingomonas sp.]MDF2496133.1 hypothetical protein [Sphingomonas sp.]
MMGRSLAAALIGAPIMATLEITQKVEAATTHLPVPPQTTGETK